MVPVNGTVTAPPHYWTIRADRRATARRAGLRGPVSSGAVNAGGPFDLVATPGRLTVPTPGSSGWSAKRKSRRHHWSGWLTATHCGFSCDRGRCCGGLGPGRAFPGRGGPGGSHAVPAHPRRAGRSGVRALRRGPAWCDGQRRGRARAARPVQHLLLDKTGTLTMGHPQWPPSSRRPGCRPRRGSPLGCFPGSGIRACAGRRHCQRRCREVRARTAGAGREVPGQGIRGMVAGHQVAVGKAGLGRGGGRPPVGQDRPPPEPPRGALTVFLPSMASRLGFCCSTTRSGPMRGRRSGPCAAAASTALSW